MAIIVGTAERVTGRMLLNSQTSYHGQRIFSGSSIWTVLGVTGKAFCRGRCQCTNILFQDLEHDVPKKTLNSDLFLIASDDIYIQSSLKGREHGGRGR